MTIPKPKHIYSVLTNIFYLLAGILIGGWYIIPFTFLTIGSIIFHWFNPDFENQHYKLAKLGEKLDVVGMYFVFLSYFITSPITIIPVVVFTILLYLFKHKFESFSMLPAFYSAAFVLKIAISPIRTILTLPIFIIALLIRTHGKYTNSEDKWHAVWHILSSIGLYLLA